MGKAVYPANMTAESSQISSTDRSMQHSKEDIIPEAGSDRDASMLHTLTTMSKEEKDSFAARKSMEEIAKMLQNGSKENKEKKDASKKSAKRDDESSSSSDPTDTNKPPSE